MLSDSTYRKQIREIYDEIGERLKKGEKLSPYDIGVDWKFSPIEYNVWCDIRYMGLPLYPEYPVGPYFIDFADPKRKIGIEVDSLQWHKDKAKDREKDRYLISFGWEIHRFPSRITYRTREQFIDKNGDLNLEDYVTDSAEGYLWSLYSVRGDFPNYAMKEISAEGIEYLTNFRKSKVAGERS